MTHTTVGFEKALVLFSDKVPTRKEYTELVWRPHYGRMINDERQKFRFMCRFADAYHSTEGMISDEKYIPKKADSDYQTIFNTDGSLKGWLPDSVDSEALKAKMLAEKEKHAEKVRDLIDSRTTVVDKEIHVLKKSLKAIQDRLSALNMSYDTDTDSSTFPNHGDIVLTDNTTDKKYYFNFMD